MVVGGVVLRGIDLLVSDEWLLDFLPAGGRMWDYELSTIEIELWSRLFG